MPLYMVGCYLMESIKMVMDPSDDDDGVLCFNPFIFFLESLLLLLLFSINSNSILFSFRFRTEISMHIFSYFYVVVGSLQTEKFLFLSFSFFWQNYFYYSSPTTTTTNNNNKIIIIIFLWSGIIYEKNDCRYHYHMKKKTSKVFHCYPNV